MRRVLGWLVILLVVGAGGKPARSSCIGPLMVCAEYARAAAVFRGRVEEVTVLAGQPGYPLVRNNLGIETTAMSGVPIMMRVRFAVLESFKGDVGAEVEMPAAGGFEKGEEYVVFAVMLIEGEHRGELRSGVCTGTERLDYPRTEADLEWLRAYPAMRATATVSGMVSKEGASGTLDEMAVELRRGDQTVSTLTQGHRYVFSGLEPGEYVVSASFPTGLTGHGPETVKLEAKGCAEVDWYLKNDSHVRGTVTDETGQPLANVPVALLMPSAGRTGSYDGTTVRTGADGRFDFAQVAEGEYGVAIYPLGPDAASPYEEVFYPAARRYEDGRRVRVEAGQWVDGLTLVRGGVLAPAVIRVRVLGNDGAAVVGGNVNLERVESGHSLGARTGGDGRAELHGFAGEEYLLRATEPTGKMCVGPVRFTAQDGLDLGTVSLDTAYPGCWKR